MWGRRGSQTATPTSTPTPARDVVAGTLVFVSASLAHCLSFPWSLDLFAQKLELGVGIPQGQTHSVFLWALPHRTPAPAKFRPTVGHLEEAEMATGQAEIVCLGACRGQSLTWVRLFSSRKGGNGSAKGSAWPRSPGEEVSGRRDSNPHPSEPRASRNPSPRGEAKGRQHSRPEG